MPTVDQIRGLLLEEALLHLLRGTGYRTIETADGDETLEAGRAGIRVKGRGGTHQIDAIADSIVHQPFSHPQRLLVEAKCYRNRNKVGLPVVRNAVGVLKDVNEYWVPAQDTLPAKKRYHYQYALFSATGYTRDAQKYAFAQDIYVIPLANSTFLYPMVDAIRGISEEDFNTESGQNIHIDISRLRRTVRNSLKGSHEYGSDALEGFGLAGSKLDEFIIAARRVNYALLAVLGSCFPVFLIPRTPQTLEGLGSLVSIKIFYDAQQWYLVNERNEQLFSFDLPSELFSLYADRGILTPQRAVDMKTEVMSGFQAIRTVRNEVRIINFRIDQAWLDYIKSHLQRGEDETQEGRQNANS